MTQNLQYIELNGNKIIALPFVLDALLKVHQELVAAGIGHDNRKGLVFAGDQTESWRSEALQKQLVANGASKTMFSNHRRGTAIDVVADWDYINKIAPTMRKHGLINDLAYWNKSTGQTRPDPAPGFVAWDGGHFNWKSNAVAASFGVINQAFNITKYPMNQYEGLILWDVEASGGFSLIKDGKRREISEKRAGKASLAVQATAPADVLAGGGRLVIPVPAEVYSSIPEGEAF